jgi:hypothetical protein
MIVVPYKAVVTTRTSCTLLKCTCVSLTYVSWAESFAQPDTILQTRARNSGARLARNRLQLYLQTPFFTKRGQVINVKICLHRLVCDQGDQIGRIFTHWAIVYFGWFYRNYRSRPHFLGIDYVFMLPKFGRATFWAIFSQTRLVALSAMASRHFKASLEFPSPRTFCVASWRHTLRRPF